MNRPLSYLLRGWTTFSCRHQRGTMPTLMGGWFGDGTVGVVVVTFLSVPKLVVRLTVQSRHASPERGRFSTFGDPIVRGTLGARHRGWDDPWQAKTEFLFLVFLFEPVCPNRTHAFVARTFPQLTKGIYENNYGFLLSNYPNRYAFMAYLRFQRHNWCRKHMNGGLYSVRFRFDLYGGRKSCTPGRKRHNSTGGRQTAVNSNP